LSLSVGDAVLTFLGDTTQLDQAFARVETNADKTMSAAADSVDEFGDSLKGVSFELDATASNAAYAGGEVDNFRDRIDKTSGSMREARGAMKLVEESLGIHIPREMNSLIAGIPALTAAFSIMLPIAGVIAAVDVIGKLIDKHDALKRAQEKVALEAENLSIKEADQTKSMELANLKLDDQIAKLEGRPEQNRLKEALIETGMAADALAARFSETFEKTNEALEETTGFFGRLKMDLYSWAALMVAMPGQIGEAFHRVTSGTKDVANAMHSVNDQLLAINKLRADLMAGKPEAEQIEHANEMAAAYKKLEGIIRSALTVVQTQAPNDEKAILALSNSVVAASAAQADAIQTVANVQKSVREATLAGAAAAATVQEKAAKQVLDAQLASIEAWKAAQNRAYEDGKLSADAWQDADVHATMLASEAHETYLGRLISIYARAGDAEKEQAAQQELATLQTTNATHEVEKLADAHKALATVAVGAAKLSLDSQLADIEKWKRAQLDAYVAGKSGLGSWEAAQIHATDAAAIAHEAYLKRVIAVYHQQGEAQKAQSAEQELAAFETSTEAKETDKLSAAMVKLTSATKQAKEAEQKLAEDILTQHYKDQEAAITKLAAMHLITEEQKDDRLKLLEQQQATAAVKILDDELKSEQKLRDEAQAKLNAAMANHGSTSTELTDLRGELAKEVAAVAEAEDKKLKAQEKFNQQSESNDKSHFARALLLATASGRELLAEQLKENHAALLAEQDELRLAKARGTDTTAIQHKITVLKQQDQELEKEASGNKKVIAAQLQVTQARLADAKSILLCLQAEGQDTTAIEKNIAALKQQEIELKSAKQSTQNLGNTIDELKKTTQEAAQTMLTSFGSAMAGMISGQESFGKAMEKATLNMLAQMAQKWAEYYLALGIGNLFTDPAAAAEEFAAAAALEAISGVMAGLASGSSGSGAGSGAGATQAGQTQASGSGGGGGQQIVGVTHLAAGGVVSKKIMIGDSPSGGDADEAILPLSDAGAMSKIVNAILPVLPQNAPGFGFATPAQRPPLGFDLSQPSSSERPDIHSGNPNDGDFERSESSMPRDMEGMQALAASFGGLLSTPTLRAAAGSSMAAASAAAAVPPAGFDSNSMEKFADRISQHMAQNGSGASSSGDTTHIHVNVKGSVDHGTIAKLVQKINRKVQNRQLTLNATNSLRVNRRSQ
jgi:hypothetical protein